MNLSLCTKRKKLDIDCALPDECKLALSRTTYQKNDLEKYYYLKCSSSHLTINFKNLSAIELSKCKLNQQSNNFVTWLTHVHIMPPFLENFQILDYISLFQSQFFLHFYFLKGFQVIEKPENFHIVDDFIIPNFFIIFHEINMEFYSIKNKKIRSCLDLIETNITHPISMFTNIQFLKYYYLGLNYAKFKTPLCPLYFRESRVTYLMVNKMIDSFYKKTILKFENFTRIEINSMIDTLEFQFTLNIHLDLGILNPFIFKNMITLILSGDMRSIKENIFLSFPKIKQIKIDFPRRIFHKQVIILIFLKQNY